MARLKTLPKLLIGGVVAGGAFLGLRALVTSGLLPMPGGKAEVPPQVALPVLPESPINADAPPAAPAPGSKAVSGGTPIRMLTWAWNAHLGLHYANGGADTTEGSLMAKNGVRLNITRQDEVPKMAAGLIELAEALQKTPDPTVGVHFITLMGDGTAAFFAELNPKLKKICADCTAEVVGSCGYSRGEDKFMGLPEWKANPRAARGALIAGVLRDGDWNIALKWAADNQIKNNPDETTYDPDALNWVATDDYIAAGKKYIVSTCEDRHVVSNGKATGETKNVCVNGVVTWTPGDVNVATQKGGLVSIVSTKEYRSQMPNVIIGIRKWNRSHRTAVEGFLSAIVEGGDQVKHYPTALHRAAEISAAIYREETPAYWEKYYHGVTETDKQGLSVPLGGSTVNNYADNRVLFGMNPGSANLYAATYTAFGDVVVAQYPKLISSYPKVEEILDTSYLQALVGKVQTAKADKPTFVAGAKITDVVSKRNWDIHFETGKATFTKDTHVELEKLARDLLIADQLVVELHGHTDNTGDPAANLTLSEQRANAVRDWLIHRAPDEFADRVRVIAHGQKEPVCADQTSETCRSKNRRVVVLLGST